MSGSSVGKSCGTNTRSCIGHRLKGRLSSAALAEDTGWVPSTHIWKLPIICSSSSTHIHKLMQANLCGVCVWVLSWALWCMPLPSSEVRVRRTLRVEGLANLAKFSERACLKKVDVNKGGPPVSLHSSGWSHSVHTFTKVAPGLTSLQTHAYLWACVHTCMCAHACAHTHKFRGWEYVLLLQKTQIQLL